MIAVSPLQAMKHVRRFIPLASHTIKKPLTRYFSSNTNNTLYLRTPEARHASLRATYNYFRNLVAGDVSLPKNLNLKYMVDEICPSLEEIDYYDKQLKDLSHEVVCTANHFDEEGDVLACKGLSKKEVNKKLDSLIRKTYEPTLGWRNKLRALQGATEIAGITAIATATEIGSNLHPAINLTIGGTVFLHGLISLYSGAKHAYNRGKFLFFHGNELKKLLNEKKKEYENGSTVITQPVQKAIAQEQKEVSTLPAQTTEQKKEMDTVSQTQTPEEIKKQQEELAHIAETRGND